MKCELCITGKLNQTNLKNRANHKSEEILDLVHSDVCALPGFFKGKKYCYFHQK